MSNAEKDIVAIVCTTDSMIYNFLIPYIKLFNSRGFKVRCFCSRTGEYFDRLTEKNIEVSEIPFTRNPLTKRNYSAYKKLVKQLKQEKVAFIFCHEPVGGVMGRMCGKKLGVPVIYMVHGFHFYKGAPLKNWMLFYPIEKAMSYLTDVLVTINSDDYRFAQKHMNAKTISYLPGVGVDISKYSPDCVDRRNKRQELGLRETDIALISVGELNENKNQIAIIEAMGRLKNNSVHYLIAGVGDSDKLLMKRAEELGLSSNVHLLGYRFDCNELYAATDIFCFPSYREGLPIALLEAMSSGLPAVASKIRGNVDLIDEDGGFLSEPNDVDHFAKNLETLINTMDFRAKMGIYNQNISRKFDIDSVIPRFEQILRSNKRIAEDWNEKSPSIVH